MELFTLLLSGLLGFLSPVGFVVDSVAQNVIRSRMEKVEQLQVRVDNAPSHQLIQGKVERVRIAGRGLWVTPDFRIAALEMETDPLNLNIQRLRQRSERSPVEGNQSQTLPSGALRQPIQAGLRFVLTQDDVNKLLASPTVTARLRNLGSGFLGNMGGQQAQAYEFVNPRIEFLADNRVRFQVALQEKGEGGDKQTNPKQLNLKVESGLGVVSGHQIQLISPTASINDSALPAFLIGPIAETISEQFDFRKLEDAGITARLLQLNIKPQQMEIAAFVQIKPDSLPQTDKK
ncbi:DUF2993 domain-containing protein [Aerosakkonema sp. BLCC-F183]|uniref:LmeA family phospholipid-binding protein n=1 Tax=Aerosakkonema sp. BLCC-F183 TaxID=3342834 RepID=UPI0035B9B2D9